MKALYAYFGLLELHTIDSPGHSLYQLGLMDQLAVQFSIKKFDFYSYYPKELIEDHIASNIFPSTQLGEIFEETRNELIEQYALDLNNVLDNVVAKKYDKLFLKARFRNLSTLSKKWKDALAFETIIDTAVGAGYSKDQIIILDTDLSLTEKFVNDYREKITILTPSIDIPGISERFLKKCVDSNLSNYETLKNRKGLGIVFYGNINTSSYKSGNSKTKLLPEILFQLSGDGVLGQLLGELTIISKPADALGFMSESSKNINRCDRPRIWDCLERDTVMLNITKDKYDTTKFIPARIYEALIFGLIPVSYKFDWLCPAFSFNNTEDLVEILKYLDECSIDDLKGAYTHFVNSYLEHSLRDK